MFGTPQKPLINSEHKNISNMPAASNFCTQVMQGLSSMLERGALPSQLRTRNGVGMVDALTSEANRTGEVLQQQYNTSKLRQVLIRYWQRADQTVLSAPEDPCTMGATKPMLEQVFDVTEYSGKACTFDMEDWISYCEGGNDVVTAQIASLFDPILQAADKYFINTVASLVLPVVGVADTNLAPIAIQLFQDFALRQINLAGQDDLINTFTDLQSTLQPIVVGQGVMRNYANVADFGCCNNIGQDLSLIMANSPFLWFDDRNVGTETGQANDLFAWEPGKLQAVFWNRYQDEQEQIKEGTMNGRSYIYSANMTIQDPITGIPFDMQIREDDCGQYSKMKVLLSLNYGLWNLADDVFAVGDEYAGVKYVARFRAS